MRSRAFFVKPGVIAALAALWLARSASAVDGLAQDSNGWTVFTPSADSRIIYVSSSGGSDAFAAYYTVTNPIIGGDPFNPTGAVQAYATVATGLAQARNGYPDWVLLRSGDAWYETLSLKNGRSASERLLIASYGLGTDRPELRTASNTAVLVSNWGISNVAVAGIAFLAHTRDPFSGEYVNSNGSVGISYTSRTNAFMAHVLFEDCRIGSYQIGCVLNNFAVMRDCAFRRNLFVDAYSINSHSQGLYAYKAALLLEENVFDHNGWLLQGAGDNVQQYGGATMFNHNTYFSDCDEVVFRGNMFLRASSIGNKWTANQGERDPVTNIVVDDNLFVDGEIGISMGGNETGNYRFVNITVTNNVFSNIGLSQPTGRTLGWCMDIQDWSNGVFAGNFLVQQTNPVVKNVYGIHVVGQSGRDVVIRDNTIWRLNSGDALKPNGVGIQSVIWLRNKVQDTDAQTRMASAVALPVGHAFYSNIYWSSRATSEWFRIGTPSYSFAQWAQLVGERGSYAGRIEFSDPDRSVERYNAVVGGLPIYTDFIARVRLQSKRTWRPEYTARAINTWIRDGFRNIGAPLFPAVLINGGAVQTADTNVMLTLCAEDPTPSVMQVSESPAFNDCDWRPYAVSSAFTVAPSIGVHTVHARFGNAATNASVTASATIVMIPEPTLTSVLGLVVGASVGRRFHSSRRAAIRSPRTAVRAAASIQIIPFARMAASASNNAP